MLRFTRLLRRLLPTDDGASLVEYGLLVGLIALVCLAAITIVGTQISAYFSDIAASL